MKVRAEGECTFDENGYKRRAACVCFKDEREDMILLITSKYYDQKLNKDWWLVPGGSIEASEDPEVAAIREVEEESGVTGKIIRSLGQVVNESKKTKTWVFALLAQHMSEHWPDSNDRHRCWFTIDQARLLLRNHKPVQIKYLDLAQTHNGKPTTPSKDMINNQTICLGNAADQRKDDDVSNHTFS